MFFIVGKGRSGTTLLQTILDTHPNTIVPWECRFVLHLRKKYTRLKHWNKSTYQQFAKDVLSDPKVNAFWKIDQKQLTNQLEQAKVQNFAHACQYVYRLFPSIFDKSDIRLLGDKNPVNSLFIKTLAQLYPNARFIHFMRDYRASTYSSYKLTKNKGKIGELALRWKKVNERIERELNSLPNQHIQVRYEDLVLHPERTLATICTFLELPFHIEMLDYHKKVKRQYDNLSQDDNLLQNMASKYHKNVSRPLDPTLIDAWKPNFTEEEVSIIEHYCATYGQRFGYQPTTASSNKPLFLQRLSDRAHYLFWQNKIHFFYRYTPFSFRSWRMKKSILRG